VNHAKTSEKFEQLIQELRNQLHQKENELKIAHEELTSSTTDVKLKDEFETQNQILLREKAQLETDLYPLLFQFINSY